jgi:anti-anti-sigma regulatory factor
MADFVFEREGGIGVLNFFGALTGESVSGLQQGLMISLENADYVIVDFRNVTGMDACCLRLFCSAHQISLRSNKRLLLTGLRPEVFCGVGNAGSLHHSGCVSECLESCLWPRGSERHLLPDADKGPDRQEKCDYCGLPVGD